MGSRTITEVLGLQKRQINFYNFLLLKLPRNWQQATGFAKKEL